MSDLPPAPLLVLCGLLGLAVGSFLNVVIWRVPRGESVVRPPSACPHCGAPIAARDNVPVLSWLLLRGTARCCGAPISRRYPLVEAVTGAAFVAVAAWLGWSWVLPAWLYLAAISVALALIDIDVHRLPDAIVLPSYPVAAVLLGGGLALDGDADRVVAALLGAVALWGFYRLLVLVYPQGMGWGDVKLAGVLGLYLGSLGWGTLVVGAFLSFLLGGVLGAALLLGGRAGRKSRLPFGPFMIVGAWLGAFWGGWMADWYVRVAGL